MTCPGETADISVRLLNVEATAGAATLRWDTPQHCRSGAAVTVTLAPGKETTVSLPVHVGRRAAKRRHDMHLLVAWRGSVQRHYQRLSVTDPVVVRLRDDEQKNLVVSLRNLSSAPQRVRGLLRVAPPLLPAASAIDRVLEPHGSVVETVTLDGWDDVLLPLRVRLELRCGRRQRVERSLLMYPFVPNGDFETDEVGDGFPEWWAGWTPRGPLDGHKRLRLDATKAAAGRSSLRLDPDTREGFYSIAQPMVARLKADTEYAVSVDILRGEDTPEVYVQIERLRLGHKDYEVGKWQRFEGTVKFANPIAFPDRNPAYDWIRWMRLYNKSTTPAWFDDLRIREVRRQEN